MRFVSERMLIRVMGSAEDEEAMVKMMVCLELQERIDTSSGLYYYIDRKSVV